MQIITTRFGARIIQAEDILLFPHGIVAFEKCRHWVILSDAEIDAVAWLQSITRPEVALPIVSPRRYVPDYRVRISRQELAALDLLNSDQAYVLSIIGIDQGLLTMNLKAPLIINLDRHLGRQVVTMDDQPLQYVLSQSSALLRKTA